MYFAPLAGTAEEARMIKALFPAARVLTGARATKTELAQVNAPSILHIATHGFFVQHATSDATENPLLRSGLALSRANLDKHAADGGILTADRGGETGITCVQIKGSAVKTVKAFPSQADNAPLPSCAEKPAVLGVHAKHKRHRRHHKKRHHKRHGREHSKRAHRR